MQKVVFFFPFFTHFFILALDCTFSGSPAQTRIAYAPAKTCCIFKTNDHIFLYKLASKLKNSLRLSKVDFKTLLVCYNAVTPTKWQNANATPNWTHSIFLEDISVKIIRRGAYMKFFMTCDTKQSKQNGF